MTLYVLLCPIKSRCFSDPFEAIQVKNQSTANHCLLANLSRRYGIRLFPGRQNLAETQYIQLYEYIPEYISFD